MSDIEKRRKLLQLANLMVKTNNAETALAACADLLNTVGSLMSEWTGEVVRVKIIFEDRGMVAENVINPEATSH